MTAKAHELPENLQDTLLECHCCVSHLHIKAFWMGFPQVRPEFSFLSSKKSFLAKTGGEPLGLSLTSFIFHFSLELQKFRLLMKGQIGVFLPSDCYRSCNTHPTAPLLSGSTAKRPLKLQGSPSCFSRSCVRWKKIELGTEVQIL